MDAFIELPHPGEHLADFIIEFGLNDRKLAASTGLTPTQVGQIRRGTRAITVATALRLGKFFGNSAEFWIGLQTQYDLAIAKSKIDLGKIQPIAG